MCRMLTSDNTLLALCVLILSITHIDQSFGFGTSRVNVEPKLNTNDYYTYDGMLDYLEQLAAAYSQRVKLRTVGTSYENRTLKAITITNGDGRKGKKVIFVIGGEHAREWLTPVAALYTVEQLVVGYEKRADLLRDYDWIVMPLVNPDGYTYSRTTDKYWRNTRSPNAGNCSGTNINRNYDIAWGTGYPELKDPCDENYAGSEPFSEPETRAIRDIMLELANEGRALMFITLHSHHTCFFYPWIHKSEPAENVRKLREVAKCGAEAIEKATGTIFYVEQYGLKDAFGGTSVDYAYSIGFPLSYAFELSETRRGNKFDFWPPPELLTELAQESWVGIRGMAEKLNYYYPDSIQSFKNATLPTDHQNKLSSSHSLENISKVVLILTAISLFSN